MQQQQQNSKACSVSRLSRLIYTSKTAAVSLSFCQHRDLLIIIILFKKKEFFKKMNLTHSPFNHFQQNKHLAETMSNDCNIGCAYL